MTTKVGKNEKTKKAKKGEPKGEPGRVSEVMIVQGLLFDAQEKDPENEKSKAEPMERKEYYDGKAVALKLEEKNNSKLYLFPSLGGEEGEWYKMGGHSALFYKYLVGPRMGRRPKIRKDNDLRLRFKYGLAAVHWGNNFVEAAKKMGYDVRTMEYGIIVVDLGKKFTMREVKDMAMREKEDKEKLATMIMPKENMPNLYVKMRELARLLVPKVKKMHAAYRETFGNDLLVAMADLFKIYFRVANGRVNKSVAKRQLLERVDDLTALVALIDEMELFDVITRTRFGEYLVDMRVVIEKNFKEKEEDE